jgi:hypothetical protein
MTLTPQDEGRLFEKEISSLLSLTRLKILSEKEVRQTYGQNNTAIDHMFENNFYIFCIQDKWEKSNVCISKINHFITCVNNISLKREKKCIGIYLSKMPLTKNSILSFDEQNNIRKNIFLNINAEDKYKMFDIFIDFLYKNKIFMFTDDNSCLMKDEYGFQIEYFF